LEVELACKQECFRVMGAAMEVHSRLGPGFQEAVYQQALEHELALQGIPFTAQKELHVEYKGRVLEATFLADVVCYDRVLMELKALKTLGPLEEAQILNYLAVSKLEVGLLVNFGSRGRLEWKRFVL